MRPLSRSDRPFAIAAGVFLLMSAIGFLGLLPLGQPLLSQGGRVFELGIGVVFLIYSGAALALAFSRLTWRWIVLTLMIAGATVFGLFLSAIIFLA